MRCWVDKTLSLVDNKNRKWIVHGYDKKVPIYGYYLPPEYEFVVSHLEIEFDGIKKTLVINDSKEAEKILFKYGVDISDMDVEE